MNATSIDGEVHGLGQAVGRQVPRVVPLHGDDPLVAPQPIRELAPAHVQGVDAAGAALAAARP